MKSLDFLFVSVLVLTACNSAPTMPTDISSSSSSSSSLSSSSAQTRVIDMTVVSFAFVPSTVNIKKGESVTIRIKGVSGLHSFGVPELGINVRIEEGQTVDITIPTHTAGSFSFRCLIPCGSGHKSMVGTIVIS